MRFKLRYLFSIILITTQSIADLVPCKKEFNGVLTTLGILDVGGNPNTKFNKKTFDKISDQNKWELEYYYTSDKNKALQSG